MKLIKASHTIAMVMLLRGALAMHAATRSRLADAEEQKSQVAHSKEFEEPSTSDMSIVLERILNDLDNCKQCELDRGSFGKVYLVNDPDKKSFYALKEVRLRKGITSLKDMREEAQIGEMIGEANSRFLLKTVSSLKNGNTRYFLSEFLPGGNLWILKQSRRALRGKEELQKHVRFFVACVIEAVDSLHSRGFVHRDLKEGNVMIDKYGYGVLIDYGLAKKIDDGKIKTYGGTAVYMAPECLLPNDGYYGKSVDWWSLGVLIYKMLFGSYPFPGSHEGEIIIKIKEGLKFPEWTENNDEKGTPEWELSEEIQSDYRDVKDLIRKLLQTDHNDRLGSDGAEDIRQHAWFKGEKPIDWDALRAKTIPAPWVPTFEGTPDKRFFFTTDIEYKKYKDAILVNDRKAAEEETKIQARRTSKAKRKRRKTSLAPRKAAPKKNIKYDFFDFLNPPD